jgi:EpsI family protein
LFTDLRDVNFTPDFPRTGEITKAMVEQGLDEDVDGVISVDPVALSYILTGTGPVVLKDGTVLTDSNVVPTLLNRVYVDSYGHSIMLSIAYGADQADDDVQLHYPEVCYPAQGYRVNTSHLAEVPTTQGLIHVRRLETQHLDQFFEPVTYWTVVGDEQSLSGWDRKLSEIRHGLKGEIVDGLLFRVSSRDRNSQQAFALQADFIRDIVQAMTPKARRQLAGLGQV